VVTDRAVLDFGGPDHAMRLRSVHPGVSVAEVQELTGFELAVPEHVPVTRPPTPAELALIRERLDPGGLRERELA
jgi:acyl CoA:acetate/3-ketoacid CoA transferase beta subunit